MAGFGPHGGGGDYGDGEGDDAPQWEQQGRKMREKAEQQLQILKSRLVSFGDRAKAVLTGKPAGGYTDLNQSLLSQGEGEEDPTVDAHPSAGAAGRQHHQQQVARVVQHIPSQTELLLELTHLSKEAAELLWETIAMQVSHRIHDCHSIGLDCFGLDPIPWARPGLICLFRAKARWPRAHWTLSRTRRCFRSSSAGSSATCRPRTGQRTSTWLPKRSRPTTCSPTAWVSTSSRNRIHLLRGHPRRMYLRRVRSRRVRPNPMRTHRNGLL
mmetsp:Transcript_2090/g.4807  ORF Transcript_2090/g.4807 Transcript_2090/m.4807 type:complete len:269 (-) Transcript_2090:206-1012(-)